MQANELCQALNWQGLHMTRSQPEKYSLPIRFLIVHSGEESWGQQEVQQNDYRGQNHSQL